MSNKEIEKLNKEALDFAETLVDTKGSFAPSRASLGNVRIDTINSLLQNPTMNYVQLAGYMEALRSNNGMIGRLFGYLQSHPTYNHSIYPTAGDKGNFDFAVDLQEYLGVAQEISRYNIKFYAPYFVKQTLVNGMSFFYKIQNTKGVSYMELPIDWCIISSFKDGVYRYSVNMSKIKEDMLGILPKELASAYEKYKGGIEKDAKGWLDGKFYNVSDKGVAFTLDLGSLVKGGVAVSEFISLIPDSMQLEKAKKNINIKDQIDTIRLIHSKIPTDSDGRPTMSSKVAKIYDSALKRSLPEGIAGITNPLDIVNIPLSGSGNSKSYDTVSKAQSQFFMSTGTPSSIFGSDTTSSNIVKLSIQKDAAWIYTNVLPLLENYYNFELSKYKSQGGAAWRVSFLRQSNFTLSEDIKTYKEAVTVGGSRTDYLAAIGMEPVEIYNKLNMEQNVLDIDSIMLPKQMSFTMSGNSNDSSGRPKTDNPTDDTDRIQNAE